MRRAGCGQPDVSEHLDRPLASLATADALVGGDRLRDLPTDGHERVQRRHRVLVDGRDLAAADARHLPLGDRGEVAPAQEHVTSRDPRAGREQPHQRKRRERLATPRLAHDPEPAAGADVERDAAHRPDRLSPRHRDLDDEVAHAEDDIGAGLGERRRHD